MSKMKDKCIACGAQLNEDKLFVFTYREEFTCDIWAKNEQEAREDLLHSEWKMLGEPHPDFLVVEVNPDN